VSAPDPAGDDRALLDGLRRGEAAAFDALYARLRAPLYGFLVRLAGRRDLADDLLQETFVKLATHAARLDADTDVKAWLFTVARNQYRSWRRWSLVDADRLRLLGLAAPAAATDTPEQRAQANEEERRLERALAELPAADREVLLLVAVEGLGQDQVAQVLGVRHDAVRQRVARARARLAAKLEAS
jgi:RNA polymerase sigma-70 factor (ECF subfamily)